MIQKLITNIDFDKESEFQKNGLYVFNLQAQLSVHSSKDGLYLLCEVVGKFSSDSSHGHIKINEKVVYTNDMSMQQILLMQSVNELSPQSRTYHLALRSLFYTTCGDLIEKYTPKTFEYMKNNNFEVGTVGPTPSELIQLIITKTYNNWDEMTVV